MIFNNVCMKKTSKFFIVFISFLILAGMSARASKPTRTHLAGDSTSNARLDFEAPVNSVIDEVIWVVGDEAILKSDVEAMRLQAETEGVRFSGKPGFIIPE